MGERGPKPKCVPTFPELTCHSVEDLHVLNTRELQRYTISQEDIDTYEREISSFLATSLWVSGLQPYKP